MNMSVMAKSIRTHIYCYDDLRVFTEEIRKKFDDPSRYAIHSFQTGDDLLQKLRSEKDHNYCKVVIIRIHDTGENIEHAGQLASEIKKTDRMTGIILLCPAVRLDEILKSLSSDFDACIPQTSNSILRIHNAVKKIFSQYNIGIYRKRRNYSFFILSGFILLFAIMLLLIYIRFPRFF